MINAQRIFQKNIEKANELGELKSYLSSLVTIPEQFEDLLRAQMIYAVSAFDKLMHDLIRIGMVQIFLGTRLATAKYQNEGVSIQYLLQLLPGSTPPPEIRFEEIIREKLSILSFQDPQKINDGLSFIWDEKHKWQKIALFLGISEEDAKRRQKLVVTRRNAIVHEADINPVTNMKQSITNPEARDSYDFLLAIGNSICGLVI